MDLQLQVALGSQFIEDGNVVCSDAGASAS